MKKKINLTNQQKACISRGISDALDDVSWLLAGADIAFKIMKNTKYKKQITALTFSVLIAGTAANIATLNYTGELDPIKEKFSSLKLKNKKEKEETPNIIDAEDEDYKIFACAE